MTTAPTAPPTVAPVLEVLVEVSTGEGDGDVKVVAIGLEDDGDEAVIIGFEDDGDVKAVALGFKLDSLLREEIEFCTLASTDVTLKEPSVVSGALSQFKAANPAGRLN